MNASSSLQEQKRNFTRARLVDAARAVFAEKGYLTATVDDIASAAGASRATFYLHFQSKQAIVAQMLAQSDTHVVERYQALDKMLASAKRDKHRLLRRWMQEWLQEWRDNGGLYHALSVALMMDADVERHVLTVGERYIDSMTKFLATVPEPERETVRARAIMLETMTRSIFALVGRKMLGMSDAVVLDYLTETWAAVFLRPTTSTATT